MDNDSSKITHHMIERMTLIHKEITCGNFPSLLKLAKSCEVGTATISRDIRFMRDRCKAPIAYDKVMNGYFYTDPDYEPSFILSDILAVKNVPTVSLYSNEDFAEFMNVPVDLIDRLEKLTDLNIKEQTSLEGNLHAKYCGRTYLNGYMWVGLKMYPFSDECKLSIGLWESYHETKRRATHIMQSKHLSYFGESTPLDEGYWLYSILDSSLLKIKLELAKKEILQFINFLQDTY